MKRARVGVIAAAVLAVAALAHAQTTDFSGTWTLDPDASQMAAGGRGGGMGGAPMTIKQTADTLTVERQMGGGTMTQTYKLDGSESVNTMQGRGGTMEVKSVAKWDGSKLVITSKRQMGDQTVETTETWSLASGVLTIEGTGGRGPTRRVYKKGA